TMSPPIIRSNMIPRAFARIRMLIVVAAVAVVGTTGMWIFRTFSLPQVQVTRLTTGPVVQAFYATGTVCPEREYSVRSNVAGILFLEPGIDKGVAVARDQLLARVVSDDLEKKLKQAQAELKEKQLRADAKDSPVIREYDKREVALNEILEIGQRELKRLMKLAESDNARQIEIDRAQ